MGLGHLHCCFVPPLVIGVAFGNLLQGVPFHMDEYMRLYYTGNFFQLLNPFGLLAGVVSVAMIITRGAAYLQMRTVGELHRSRATAQVAALITLVCFWQVFGSGHGIDGYVVTSAINHVAPSTRMTKKWRVRGRCMAGELQRDACAVGYSALGVAAAADSSDVSSGKKALWRSCSHH